jgi:hypothetical protein
MATIFVACPTYNGWLHAGAARSLYITGSKLHRLIGNEPGPSSLLTLACNDLWAEALNARDEKGVPLKNRGGVLSTAVSESGDPGIPRFRLIVRQVLHPEFPRTFGIADCISALARLPPEMRIETQAAAST